MDTTMLRKQTHSYREHWQAVGGERFYTLARWVMLALLFAISFPGLKEPVWPVSLSSSPLVLTLWAYTIFSMLLSIALFVPPLRTITSQAYILDIALILLLMWFSGMNVIIFLPFFFLPLIGAAVQHQPIISLVAGIITALLYTGVFLLTRDQSTRLDLSTIIQALMLIFIPWFTSSLAEKWNRNTRRMISESEQREAQAQQETERYRERLRSFATISDTLAGSMDYKKVLNTALHEIQKFAPYKVGMILLSSGRPKELFVAVVEPPNPNDQERTFTTNEGTISTMLRPNATAILVENIGQEPELESLTTLRSCKAACVVPLRLKLNTYGMLLIASEQAGAFRQEQLDMISGMASSIIVALHATQLAFDLKQMHTRLLTNEKEMRNRIASKLHDGPTQKVAQIAMNTDFIKKVAQHEPARLTAELDTFAALAKAANSEMRMTLFELRPLTLESEGLRKAIAEYVDKVKLRSGTTQIKLQARGDVDTALSLDAAGVVFDIIQESVNNALKHAEAKTISIRLERLEELFVVAIKDDGKGFDPTTAKQDAAKRASFGLHNFSERAQMIDGTVEIDSSPGKGATVTITVSLNPES